MERSCYSMLCVVQGGGGFRGPPGGGNRGPPRNSRGPQTTQSRVYRPQGGRVGHHIYVLIIVL